MKLRLGNHLTRSVLYTPCDKMKAMEKTINSVRPDIIIFDLEDAVSPANKDMARDNLYNFMQSKRHLIKSEVIVRVNCRITTRWGHDDLLLAKDLPIDGIALPKVNDIHNLAFSAEHIENKLPIWCMIETALGVRNVNALLSHKRVEGMIFGSNDLMKDLGITPTVSRAPLWYSMSKCIVAAKSVRKIAIDGVFMNIQDSQGFREECIQGQQFGFHGKSLIHPSQVDIANEVYSPSDADIIHANRVVDAFDDALSKGSSVAVLDGRLVESLHVEHAKQVIARRKAVDERTMSG